MCPTDVVEENCRHKHHDQGENGSAAAGPEGKPQQTNCGGKSSHNCCTGGHVGSEVSVAALSSRNGREHAELLSKTRDACERQNCSTKDVSDATLLRFLKARSMKVDKAAKMLVNYQNWRASYIPLGYVPDSECPQELAAKKFFLQGRSRLGWAVTVVHCRYHYALQRDLEELKRAIVYFLDKSIASAAPEAEKLLVIMDLKDIGYKNLDARAFIAGFGFLQAYYPERLARCLMINAPSIFMAMWKVIHRFLDPETKSKIVFVEHDKITEACLSDMDMEVIPAPYGGKAELTLLQDAVVPNWPPGKNI